MDRRRLTGTRDHSASEDVQESQESAPTKRTRDAAGRFAGHSSATPEPPTDLAENSESDLDRVVGHVRSVLNAAEEAAVRIQEEARQEAERIRDQARKEAANRAEAARRDADETTTEAERLRADAEEWSRQTRETAEKDAVGRRAKAEAEAKDILSAAQRQAVAFAADGASRQQKLTSNISLAEDRLGQLASGLHDLAVRLETLLSAPVNAQASTAAQDDVFIEAAVSEREPEEVTT